MVRRLGNNNNNHNHKTKNKNQYYEGVRSYSREDLPDLPEGMNPASPEAVKGKSLSEKNGTTTSSSFEIDLPERRISLSQDEEDDIEVIETGVSHWVPQTVRWKIVTVLLVLAVGFSSFVVRFHSLTGEEETEGLHLQGLRECFESNEELKRAVDLFMIVQQEQPDTTTNNASATYQEEWKSLTDTYGSSISHWCVLNLTNLTGLFSAVRNPAAAHFNEDLSPWDVSNVRTFEGMFQGAAAFNQPLSSWNVSSAVRFHAMFLGATSFNQSLETWDVSQARDMRYLFSNAKAFQQPLNRWNVSSVTDMTGMFKGAAHFNQPLEAWDVSHVTKTAYMFALAKSFNQPLNRWNVSAVTSMEAMFLEAFSFQQPINQWTPVHVKNMERMFAQARAFSQDLCPWANYLPADCVAHNFAVGSSCLNFDATNLTRTPPGPLCFTCH